MSILYLTPASIGYLTQFILASTVAGYFWYLARRSRQGENNALPTTLLAGAFTSFACGILLVFLDASHPDWRFYAMPLESIAMVLFLALFLQFAYRFPSLAPNQKREARVVLWLTILYALGEGGFAIHRYAMLAQGIVRYRRAVADIPLAVGFLWLAMVFLRQTVRTSSFDYAQDRPVDRGVTVWRKLWRPRGRAARAARAFALLSILPLGFNVVNLLRGYGILPQGTTELIHSLGILFTLSAFALVYLNYLPETTSFMVKLVGVTLAAILGSVGWILTPSCVAAYHNDRFITDKQTLRFTPNSRGDTTLRRLLSTSTRISAQIWAMAIRGWNWRLTSPSTTRFGARLTFLTTGPSALGRRLATGWILIIAMARCRLSFLYIWIW